MGVKSKEVIFIPTAPLYFIISGGTLSIVPQYKKDDIVSLAMPNNYFIAVGDTLRIKGEPYKVNIIEKVVKKEIVSYHLKTAERTKSSVFVLPMLSGNKNLFLYDSHLINAFIGVKDIKDHLVLLYRWSEDPLFAKFDLALKKFPTFVKAYDPDPSHTVYVFEIPDIHIKECELPDDSELLSIIDIEKETLNLNYYL